MIVYDIVLEKLEAVGADGLCNINCGCGIDDLMPCDSAPVDCLVAKKVSCAEYRKHMAWTCDLKCEECDMLNGDTYFIPLGSPAVMSEAAANSGWLNREAGAKPEK